MKSADSRGYDEFVETIEYTNEKYKEIWIDTNDEQHMCALINGNRGMLMYMPDEEGSSFISRNGDYSGNMEFLLDNG